MLKLKRALSRKNKIPFAVSRKIYTHRLFQIVTTKMKELLYFVLKNKMLAFHLVVLDH